MTNTLTYNRRIEWLGNFPNHWQIKRIKNLFTEVDERSVNGDEELLSVSQFTGITPKRDCLENEDDFISNAESLEGYKKVTQGDLVINIMLAWNGSLGISPYKGIVSPAYCVYRCLPGNNPEYFGYLFSTALYKAEFRRNSTGIIDSRLRLYSDKFFSIFSIVPSLNEQNAIVDKINNQSERINRFIDAKLRFIELLKEQRQGIINHSVTKGIYPNIEMKSTEIDWLGNVPKHWQIRKLKFSVKYNSTEINTEDISDETFKIALENIDNWTGRYIDTGNPQFEGKGKPFNTGDVLFNKLRPYLAKAYITEKDGYCVGELLVLKPKSEIITKNFLFQILMTPTFIGIVNSSTYGAKMPRANWNFIGNLKITLPPICEQENILKQIKTETATIDTAIAKAENEIVLMREYKEAMIAEAVTGKIKIMADKVLV